MDWKIMISTFAAVFFAEMADKTQMVGITMASKSSKPIAVFLGSVLAYMIITAISVFLGASFGHLLKREWLQWGSGGLFVIIGILMFLGKI